MEMKSLLCFSALISSVVSHAALAYEDAKVMPQNIRRLTYRFVLSDISEKTDGSATAFPLSRPLSKALTFKDIVKGEKDPVRNALTSGFIGAEGFQMTDAAGHFVADVQTRVQVSAPIFAYGLTSAMTLAVALPVYRMQTSADVSFQASDNGQQFINRLASDYNNQTASANEAATKLNDAVERLNTKLTDNGYRRLESWQGSGLGDAQLVLKHKSLEKGAVSLAAQAVLTMPTGRLDDPDNLLDKGFGDGQWDLALGATSEESMDALFEGLSLTQFIRVTEQFSGRRTIRLVTEAETIEVEKASVEFDLGARLETGAAVLFSSQQSGWGGAVGYNFSRKGFDRFQAPAETRAILEKDSLEMMHQAEAEVVFSGVPAFRRGSIPIPFELKLAYKHQLSSRNMPVAHMLQIDTGVFF
jgi:hypothetical protein